jgi:hypothetical protein
MGCPSNLLLALCFWVASHVRNAAAGQRKPPKAQPTLRLLRALLRETAQEADNTAPRLDVLHSRRLHPGARKQFLRR